LLAVLVLAPVLSVVLSGVLVLSILHFLTRIPGSAVEEGRVADPRLLRDVIEPFRQEGTVELKQLGGIVYYPVPYANPPHLKLTMKSAERSVNIVRQDEHGFVWGVELTMKDGKNLFGAFKGVKSVEDLPGVLAAVDSKGLPALKPGEAFTWEARGVRPFMTAATAPPFQQTGTFLVPQLNPGVSYGRVEHFQHPYATPPNLTFSAEVKVLATTATGFRWEKWGWVPDQIKITWTARGVRATSEQVAELSRRPPAFGDDPPPQLEQSGNLSYALGETGEVGFPRPYVNPPSIEVQYVLVTEVTPRGFKWKEPTVKPDNKRVSQTQWKAKGVPARP
jgi:hypothetical protein